MIVSPEKNATAPSPAVIRVNVENPWMRPASSSRSRITASLSRRSVSKRARVVPSKYARSSSYISRRSFSVTDAVGTIEPTRRYGASERGDVDVRETRIERFITGAYVGPRRQVKTAGIGNVRVCAGDVEQGIANVETDEQVIESTTRRQAVDLPQKCFEDLRVVIG